MPPKAKITREMVIDAAFEVARQNGADSINARTVADKLGCSTQPVMYHFKTINDLKKAAYQRADEYHSEYLNCIEGKSPLSEIGLAYIRFAAEEPLLFRFLFQSDSFHGKSIVDLIDDEALMPILEIFSQAIGMEIAKTKEVFRILFLFVHGYAAILANNAVTFDEKAIEKDLERVLNGAIYTELEESE